MISKIFSVLLSNKPENPFQTMTSKKIDSSCPDPSKLNIYSSLIWIAKFVEAYDYDTKPVK